MRKFAKFKNKIAMLKKCYLTLERKKLVINSYIISSVSYLVNVYTDHIPKAFIKQIKELIIDFLWTENMYFSKSVRHEKMPWRAGTTQSRHLHRM